MLIGIALDFIDVSHLLFCVVPFSVGMSGIIEAIECVFCEQVSMKFNGDHKAVTRKRLNLVTLSFGDITGFMTVLYVMVISTLCSIVFDDLLLISRYTARLPTE